MDSDYPRGTCENVVYHSHVTIQTIITFYLRLVSLYHGGHGFIYNLRLKGRLWDCTFFESQYVSIQFQPLARKEVSWWIINVDKTCEEFNERTPSSLPDRQESIFRIFVTKES